MLASKHKRKGTRQRERVTPAIVASVLKDQRVSSSTLSSFPVGRSLFRSPFASVQAITFAIKSFHRGEEEDEGWHCSTHVARYIPYTLQYYSLHCLSAKTPTGRDRSNPTGVSGRDLGVSPTRLAYKQSNSCPQGQN